MPRTTTTEPSTIVDHELLPGDQRRNFRITTREPNQTDSHCYDDLSTNTPHCPQTSQNPNLEKLERHPHTDDHTTELIQKDLKYTPNKHADEPKMTTNHTTRPHRYIATTSTHEDTEEKMKHHPRPTHFKNLSNESSNHMNHTEHDHDEMAYHPTDGVTTKRHKTQRSTTTRKCSTTQRTTRHLRDSMTSAAPRHKHASSTTKRSSTTHSKITTAPTLLPPNTLVGTCKRWRRPQQNHHHTRTNKRRGHHRHCAHEGGVSRGVVFWRQRLSRERATWWGEVVCAAMLAESGVRPPRVAAGP